VDIIASVKVGLEDADINMVEVDFKNEVIARA
jgi:hypothetical protein